MACHVIFQFTLKGGRTDELRKWMSAILPTTRAYEGCVNISVAQNQDHPLEFLVVQQWVNRARYEEFLQWRMRSGEYGNLLKLIEGDPVLRFYDDFGV